MTDPVREQFESFVCDRWHCHRTALVRTENGEYLSGPQQFAYDAWTAARAQALEDAAKVCEEQCDEGSNRQYNIGCDDCAAAIRALK